MMKSTRCLKTKAFLLALLVAYAAPSCADDARPLTDAEQAFVKQLSNRVMAGHFTIDGQGDGSGKMEKYTIGQVSKVDGDQWTVEARIQYGKVDAAVPVPVHVNWAGDTPVLSVTNLSIPLLGDEFSARILFDGDRYAGTWKHGQAGGHMWGHLEDAPAQAKTPAN
ncbi:MAG: hypothetical protein ACK5Q5_09055 [Planctomycetaceae bacterium]